MAAGSRIQFEHVKCDMPVIQSNDNYSCGTGYGEERSKWYMFGVHAHVWYLKPRGKDIFQSMNKCREEKKSEDYARG